MLEKRGTRRIHVSLPVLCEPSHGEPFGGTIVDIGLGGSCIECTEVPGFGTELCIVTLLPGAADVSRLPATVRWARDGTFGVQFGLLGARDTRLIVELMSRAGGSD
jgi:hypothetical protein